MAKMPTNPDKVEFSQAPFYNMAKVRVEFLRLIARANGDPDKMKCIEEFLSVASDFAELRFEADVAVRKAAAKQAAAATAKMLADAENAEKDEAKKTITLGQKMIDAANKVLNPEKSPKDEKKVEKAPEGSTTE